MSYVVIKKIYLSSIIDPPPLANVLTEHMDKAFV